MTYVRGDANTTFPAVSVAKFDAVRQLTVYAVLLFLVPATLIFAPLGGEGTPAMVFSLCVLLLYLTSWITGRIEPSGGGRLVRMAMLFFAVTVLASFVAAMTRDITQTEVLQADNGLVWLASSAGLVVVTTEAIRDFSQLELLLRRLVVLGSVIAFIGILQFRGIDLTKFIHIPGLTVNTQNVTPLLNRGGFLRPQSTSTQPIEFSVVMAMLLPFAIEQAFEQDRGGWFRRWTPVVLIGLAGPLTVSRSGVLGIGAALLVLLPTWKLRRMIGALGVIAIGVILLRFIAHGLVSTLANLFQGIFNSQDSSAKARTSDYSGVFQYVTERPIFGRGFGTFLPQLYRFTDNMYLHAIVEIGVVGVIAMFFLFCSGIQSAVLGRRRTKQPSQRGLGQALVASMAVAMVTSFTFDSLTFPMFSGLFFMLLGCCGAYRTIVTSDMRIDSAVIPLPSKRIDRRFDHSRFRQFRSLDNHIDMRR